MLAATPDLPDHQPAGFLGTRKNGAKLSTFSMRQPNVKRRLHWVKMLIL